MQSVRSNTGGRLEVSYDLIFLQSRQCAQQWGTTDFV